MRIAFFSTMGGLPWGGSEELWSRAAKALLDRGYEVAFSTSKWPSVARPLDELRHHGAVASFRSRRLIGRTLRRTLEGLRLLRLKHMHWLRTTNPDLVVISFSCHTDDPQIAITCRMLGVRYVILLQAAGPNAWIDARSLADFRAAYIHAEKCYFVSEENRELLRMNLALDLAHSEIVDNPFNVNLTVAPTWPATCPTWKLACVARVQFATKAQDLLLRVLRLPKWRERPLQVALWGSDNGFLGQVRQLIELYGLHNQIYYAGFATDVAALWSEHHGLLLPSRMEGNPLSLIEAMLCGRVPITTNVGRAAELIDDGQSGFLAPAATAELIDDVLERAWQRRDEWQAMGQCAAEAIRLRHSLQPGEDFADRILSIAKRPKSRHRRAA